jgi:hypothetical protein
MGGRGAVLSAILWGGLVAATLDIGAAVLISGKSFGFILQFIASGLVGKASFEGGVATMALGLALQELMGLIIAAVFVLASLRLPMLRRRWSIWGLLYGAGIFAVMNYVVVPLSAVGRFPKFSPESFVKNLVAMLLFGLIVAWFARRRVGEGVADFR